MMSGGFAGIEAGLAVYAAAVLVYTAAEARRRGKISAAAKGAFSVAIPIAGLAILVLYDFFGKALGLTERTGSKDADENLSLSFGEHAYSGDIVPLHDMFLMDDAKLKRKFFTDAIKQNVVERQSILNEAVHDSDREIAYYAVSLMTAHMEQLSEEIYALEEEIKRGCDDDALLNEYVAKVREFLLRQYGDSVMRAQQRMRYMEMLRVLAERHPEHPAYQAESIREMIRAGQFAEAERACALFRTQHPKAELPRLRMLHLAQASYDTEQMRAAVDALKKLPARLSNEAMQAIRYWDGGAAHE